jgi:hypothetical protein
MSRGLSKIQRSICAILRGEARRVYVGRGLVTSEILTELAKIGLVNERRPRKQLMNNLSRACWSLVRRKLVVGTVTFDAATGKHPIEWRIAASRRLKGQRARSSASRGPAEALSDGRARAPRARS